MLGNKNKPQCYEEVTAKLESLAMENESLKIRVALLELEAWGDGKSNV